MTVQAGLKTHASFSKGQKPDKFVQNQLIFSNLLNLDKSFYNIFYGL